jgi:hypothetical protein
MSIREESTNRARAALGGRATAGQVAEAATRIECAVLDARCDAALPTMPEMIEVAVVQHDDGRRERQIRIGDQLTIRVTWPVRS